MKEIDILIPTYNRIESLIATLTSLSLQSRHNFNLVISDQSTRYQIKDNRVLKSLIRIFENLHVEVKIYRHLPRKGMAEQRNFLLNKSSAPYVFFLDDDVYLDCFVIENLIQTLKKFDCGFVGMGLIGLSFKNDHRPKEEKIRFWEGKIYPEKINPYDSNWNRFLLHNGANLLHLQNRIQTKSNSPLPYKISWVGGCVLYNKKKLQDSGGFDFWKKVPLNHSGEDVEAQLRVMEKYGGCAILPSGAYHLELETTIKDRRINLPLFFKYLFPKKNNAGNKKNNKNKPC